MIGPLPVVPINPVPCKICHAPSALFGVTDFNRSCEEHRAPKLPLSGIPIYYNRCSNCGFVFTSAFDDWSNQTFSERIYNRDYIKVDPDYVELRPSANAQTICDLFGAARHRLSLLDYGGGNGGLALRLRAAAFGNVQTYDPFNPLYARPPEGRFDIVTCFETLEHSVNPNLLIETLASYVNDNGIVYFSTLLQDNSFEQQGLAWWYIGPRNGHVSIYSKRALEIVWKRVGFQVASNPTGGWHFAFRNIPKFAAHLFSRQ